MICSKASRRLAAAALSAAAALAGSGVRAAPHRPAGDEVVLERLSPASVALRRLRGDQPATRHTASATDAVAAARHYVELGRTYADPRAYGYAQAALGAWWDVEPAPAPVRIMRARILQFRHDFDGALRELEAALRAEPFAADAWLLFASIEQVRGDARAARAACLKLVTLADPLVSATCAATNAELGGRPAEAIALIEGALARPSAVSADVRAWATTTLGELRGRAGEVDRADAAFRDALQLAPGDVYARAAYADLLLDAGQPQKALALLGTDPLQADATLLRAAIAAKRSGDRAAHGLALALDERFAEARSRGDTTHLREQAMFALAVRDRAGEALALAGRNFAVQREPADARILLESAIAAGNPQAAAPAIDWLRATGIAAPRLRTLAARASAGERQ